MELIIALACTVSPIKLNGANDTQSTMVQYG